MYCMHATQNRNVYYTALRMWLYVQAVLLLTLNNQTYMRKTDTRYQHIT